MKGTNLLKDSQVKAAKPREGAYQISDGRGLALRILKSGAKSWVFNYYHPFTKKRTSIGLGAYPDRSLASAREKRDEYRTLVLSKIDPREYEIRQHIEEKQKRNSTFKAMADIWKEIKLNKDIKEQTVNREYRCLEIHLFPAIGDEPVHEIKYLTVLDAIKLVEAAGSHETVKRLCRLVNEIFDLAAARELVESNKFGRITKEFKAHKKTNNPKLDISELPQLLSVLANSTALKRTRLMIEFQLHTMTRPNETAKAEWTDFDLQEKLWVIPAEKMKMKREHIIPLTEPVMLLLEQIKMLSRNSNYLFPNHRKLGTHASPEAANTFLKRNGFKDKQTAHGLRSLASTALNENGFDRVIVDACLAHVDKNLTSRAYNRAQYIEQKKRVFTWWSEFIVNAAQGNVSLAQGIRTLRLVN
ncbi:tyrosine-type recombinase/integrase [Marisediminitalea sp.]|uniref:tyrosine-type recombinase/integrase n=1 Tax=Marisediminitalea sp. TaxID=2662268 RepID=UPI00351335B7